MPITSYKCSVACIKGYTPVYILSSSHSGQLHAPGKQNTKATTLLDYSHQPQRYIDSILGGYTKPLQPLIRTSYLINQAGGCNKHMELPFYKNQNAAIVNSDQANGFLGELHNWDTLCHEK